MRVYMPPEHQASPADHLIENYDSEILQAGINFATTIYCNSTLSMREFEAARARTAEINGCQLCQKYRVEHDLPGFFNSMAKGKSGTSILSNGPAPDENFYLNVSNWQQYSAYSEREKVAIRYAEGMGLDPQGLAKDDAFWQQAKSVYDDKELVELSYCIGCWMGLGRASHVLGTDGVCPWMSNAEK